MIARALYFDGRIAGGQPATVTVLAQNLVISCDNGKVVHWPLSHLRYVDPPSDGLPPRLRNLFDQPDRLTFDDASDLSPLVSLCPNLTRADSAWLQNWPRLLMWGVGAIVSIFILFQIVLPSLSQVIAVNLPPSTETRLKEVAKTQIIRILSFDSGNPAGSPKICNGAGMQILERLTRALSADSIVGIHKYYPPRIEVVDLDIDNAFALPDNTILLFSGLLSSLRNPNELAGILAHEIAHLQMRHPTELYLREIGTFAIVGLLFGDVTGGSVLAGASNLLIGSSYSRNAEEMADGSAVSMMNKAGFDARPLADYLSRLTSEERTYEKRFPLLISHPAAADRAAHIRDWATGTGSALSEPDWRLVRQICS